jgi:hypothetical protein
MKTFINALKIAAGSTVLALSLVACGETTTSTSTPDTSSVPTPPPAPVVPAKWDSDSERAALEDSIMNNTSNSFTGAESHTASVSCKATATKNIWTCDIRDLGDEAPTPYRIEYVNGTWAGKPIV